MIYPNECDIISDLLPLYLEHMTRAETNEFIQEHISVCDSCRASYEHMSCSYEEIVSSNDIGDMISDNGKEAGK